MDFRVDVPFFKCSYMYNGATSIPHCIFTSFTIEQISVEVIDGVYQHDYDCDQEGGSILSSASITPQNKTCLIIESKIKYSCSKYLKSSPRFTQHNIRSLLEYLNTSTQYIMCDSDIDSQQCDGIRLPASFVDDDEAKINQMVAYIDLSTNSYEHNKIALVNIESINLIISILVALPDKKVIIFDSKCSNMAFYISLQLLIFEYGEERIVIHCGEFRETAHKLYSTNDLDVVVMSGVSSNNKHDNDFSNIHKDVLLEDIKTSYDIAKPKALVIVMGCDNELVNIQDEKFMASQGWKHAQSFGLVKNSAANFQNYQLCKFFFFACLIVLLLFSHVLSNCFYMMNDRCGYYA